MTMLREGCMIEETDAEERGSDRLLWEAQQGDVAALERLLAPYEAGLLALCRGILGHAEDAEDAVQETFLRTLRALPGFRGESRFRTWLYRIAIHICIDWKRSPRRTHRSLEGLSEALIANETSLEATVLQKIRISEALRELLPRHRALILLKEGEGWSVGEIADAMGCSEKRVQNELYRTRRALVAWRRRVGEKGETV